MYQDPFSAVCLLDDHFIGAELGTRPLGLEQLLAHRPLSVQVASLLAGELGSRRMPHHPTLCRGRMWSYLSKCFRCLTVMSEEKGGKVTGNYSSKCRQTSTKSYTLAVARKILCKVALL